MVYGLRLPKLVHCNETLAKASTFIFYNIWKHKREPLEQPPYHINGYTLQITRNQLPSTTTVCYHSPVVSAFWEKCFPKYQCFANTGLFRWRKTICSLILNDPARLRSMCVFSCRIRELDTCILLCQCTVYRSIMGYKKRSTSGAGIDWITVSAASSYIHPVMSEEAEEFPHKSIGRISDVTYLEQPYCSLRGTQQGSARCVLPPGLRIPN
ncbi:unnamed protein product [Brugia pahangi]|uniref:cDNA n=1 Tax=Brugia pahangi TaxID=6280 RepID=A0A0N4TK94_BRUPA|nr:unnamed protein product [Brugia pahangi]